MSNEGMANSITDVPSAIAELLAINKQLEQTIQRQEKIIELLKQSNSFYADINNWTGEDINGWNCTNVIKSEDQEKLETVWVMGSSYPKPDEYDDCGGKLARSIKQQVKELEDKQGEG